MAGMTIEGGCCMLLLVVLIAMCGDFHKAIGQLTTSPDVAVGNDLQHTVSDVTKQLNLLMESMNQLRQENLEMSQYIIDIRRQQVESDKAVKTSFELLAQDNAEMKRELKEEIVVIKAILSRPDQTCNVSRVSFDILRQDNVEMELDLKNELAAVKEHVVQCATRNSIVALLREHSAETNKETKLEFADVKKQLQSIIADNETRTSLIQLDQGHVQLKNDLEATMTDVKLQLMQQLNAATEYLNASRQSDNNCANVTRPRDCSDVMALGSTVSGTYTVFAGSTLRPLLVYCDMSTDNGGWTVFQRRKDGSENFLRNWVDYANGFGDLHGEFWLGNDNIYSLTTNDKQYKLRVDLADFNGNSRYAEYEHFRVGPPWQKYKLVSLGTYSGDAGDALSYHVGSNFSTVDQDNDEYASQCAVQFKGAWWYKACHFANLNGHYYGGQHESYADGVEWEQWTGQFYSLRLTSMKIRPMVS